MINFKFKLKQKTIKATVPEGWHEVTLKQVVALEAWSGEATDMIGLLEAFTDQTFEALEQAKGNLWNPLFNVLSFVFEAPKWDKLKIPKQVTLKHRKIKPPRNVELETFGQKVMAFNLITSKQSEIKKLPDIISIYLQPAYDGIFSSDRAKELKENVLNMLAFEAMPIGLFFFKKLLRKKDFGRIGFNPSKKIYKKLLSVSRQVQSN